MDRLEAPVLAGTATYGAVLRESGVVACTGLGDVVLGPRDGGSSELAERVGEAFAAAGLETTVADDMPDDCGRNWRSTPVSTGDGAFGCRQQGRSRGPASDLASAATRETARVARACDVSISSREAITAMERVAADTAANTSSMRQDVRAGRRTEIDAINGYVVERANELGLEAPTNRTVTSLIRTWERGSGLR